LLLVLQSLLIVSCKKTANTTCAGYTFYIPDSFSPNGDGLNDTFGPKGEGTVNFEMWIYDANNKLIYHTASITVPWDGSVNGTICQQGAYIYIMNSTDECGNNHTYTGTVYLIK